MDLTEDSILPGVTQIFRLEEGHSDYYTPTWRYWVKDCGGVGDVQEVVGSLFNETRFPTVGPRLPRFYAFLCNSLCISNLDWCIKGLVIQKCNLRNLGKPCKERKYYKARNVIWKIHLSTS